MARQSARPTVEELQAELADADDRVRRVAIKKLMRYQRQQAVEPLLSMLKDAQWTVRAAAVQALGVLKDRRAVTPLVGLLTDKSASVRVQAIRTLGDLGERGVASSLNNFLVDPRPTIRQAAARSLGKLRDATSLPLLLAYLQQAEEDEYYYLIYALGDFDTPAVIEPLLALCETDERLQYLVAEGLSRLGASSTPALVQIATDMERPPISRKCVVLSFAKSPRLGVMQSLLLLLKDSDAQMREFAVQALGTLRDPGVVEPLIRVLSDKNEKVCQRAIFTLGTLEATDCAIDQLIVCLSSRKKSVIYAAALALEKLKAVQATPALLDVVCSLRRYSCWPVVTALGNLGGPELVDELLRRLPTMPRDICWRAVSILERFPDPRSVEPLLTLLDPTQEHEGKGNLQIQVVRLLGKLGDTRAIGPLRKMRPRTSGVLQSTIIHTLKALESVPSRLTVRD